MHPSTYGCCPYVVVLAQSLALRVIVCCIMTHIVADALELDAPFSGAITDLPTCNPRGSAFFTVPFLRTKCGHNLYVVYVPDTVVGGRRDRRERLCVLFLNHADLFVTAGLRTAEIKSRFYWLDSAQRLRYAPLTRATNGKRSLKLTAYADRGRRCDLHAHRVLGWSFAIARSDPVQRWRHGWDIHHRDDIHEHHFIDNLRPWISTGRGGHRADAGRTGAVARRRLN